MIADGSTGATATVKELRAAAVPISALAPRRAAAQTAAATRRRATRFPLMPSPRLKHLAERGAGGKGAHEAVLGLVRSGPVDRVAVLEDDEREAVADVAGERRRDVR